MSSISLEKSLSKPSKYQTFGRHCLVSFYGNNRNDINQNYYHCKLMGLLLLNHSVDLFILAFLAPNPASSREILESIQKTSEHREFEFIKRYCLDVTQVNQRQVSIFLDSIRLIKSSPKPFYGTLLIQLSQGDMPQKADLPTLNERSEFLNWVESLFKKPHVNQDLTRVLRCSTTKSSGILSFRSRFARYSF